MSNKETEQETDPGQPLMVHLVELRSRLRHFSRPKLQTISAIAFVVGLVLYTTHFQMAYFLFGAVGMYAIFRAVALWREAKPSAAADRPYGRSVRPAAIRFGLFLTAAVMGAGIAAV